ncbi:MAG: hypothetical protein NVS1B14_07810 [Vulcanimicrobiaceae bacterium]
MKNNLYKIWIRMSSGTYFPPPVRMVSIPKSNGGVRVLGIPTVGDRIAQTVVKMYLEPLVERKRPLSTVLTTNGRVIVGDQACIGS